MRQHEEFGGECEVSHPHQTVVRGDVVWVVDLGCDAVWQFRHRAGADRLERVGATRTPAGCGPRHMALHPSKPLAFLLCEQDSLVLVYRFPPPLSSLLSLNSSFLRRIQTDGGLTETQRLPLSSHRGDYGAEILVNTAGDRLYASSRGSGVLLVYRITGDRLEREENMFNMSGSWPRHFALRENILVTTDQRGRSAQVVHIDSQGLLLPGKTFTVEEQPAFVTFL